MCLILFLNSLNLGQNLDIFTQYSIQPLQKIDCCFLHTSPACTLSVTHATLYEFHFMTKYFIRIKYSVSCIWITLENSVESGGHAIFSINFLNLSRGKFSILQLLRIFLLLRVVHGEHRKSYWKIETFHKIRSWKSAYLTEKVSRSPQHDSLFSTNNI